MIGREILDELSDRFGQASWAIWSEDFPADSCLEARAWNGDDTNAIYRMIVENIDKLRPDVILLGVNPSDQLKGRCSNFHSPDGKHNDRYLKRTIQDRNLENIHGAYMTDLLKGQDTAVAHEAGRLKDDQIALFEEELSLLDRSKYDVICFGKSKFERVLSGQFEGDIERIDDVSPPILRMQTNSFVKPVTFYIVYHYIRTHRSSMDRQLRYLNEELSSTP